MERPGRLELYLTLPYKLEVRDHPQVRRYLEQGYKVTQLQRLTDRDAVVVLALPPGGQASPSAG